MNNNKDILIVVAMRHEIEPFLEKCELIHEGKEVLTAKYLQKNIDILVTGVGIPFTVFQMTRHLGNNSYFLAVNCGIAGCFNDQHKIGDVVFVSEDQFSDIGIEYPDHFRTIFEEKLADENSKPFINSKLVGKPGAFGKYLNGMTGVSSITVNRVHGNNESIQNDVLKFNPVVESMEGAAFFYVCQQFEIPHIQIRSVSNKVEPRNKENWNISLAIENLNLKLLDLLNQICNK